MHFLFSDEEPNTYITAECVFSLAKTAFWNGGVTTIRQGKFHIIESDICLKAANISEEKHGQEHLTFNNCASSTSDSVVNKPKEKTLKKQPFPPRGEQGLLPTKIKSDRNQYSADPSAFELLTNLPHIPGRA